MSASSREKSSTGSSFGQRPDAVSEVDRLKQTVRHRDMSLTFHRGQAYRETARLTDQLSDARRQLNAYLRRHFYTTPEVAGLLGVSEHLVQAMAAQGPTAVRCDSGKVLMLGLRAIRHGKLWFPKADIDQLLADLDFASRR